LPVASSAKFLIGPKRTVTLGSVCLYLV